LCWLAEACVEAGLEDLAVAVAADLVQTADRASVAVDLAQHHVKAGRIPQATARLAEALALAKDAQQLGEDASFALRELAETAVDLGLIDQAVQVASALQPDWLAVQTLCAVAVRCAQSWQHAPVAAIFDQALAGVAALTSEADRAFRPVELLNSRVQTGLLDHTPVRRVAESLQQAEAGARVWLAIAEREADFGDRERALAAVDDVYATARVIQEDGAGAKVLAAVADLYSRGREPARAAEVLCLAQQRAEGIEPPHRRAEALVAIATIHATAGESAVAEQLLVQAVTKLDPD
jgi:tetratricopeptide (TPR) repeat protein